MNVGDLLVEARAVLDDEVGTDFLWPDDQLIRYLAEGEREACRRARLLFDDETEEICLAPVQAGVRQYRLDARVVSVERAILSSRSSDLQRMNEYGLNQLDPSWRTASGIPSRFTVISKGGGQYLYLDRAPTSDDTLMLSVYRMPLNSLSRVADQPEIPEIYHLGLLEWLYYRAYLKGDEEITNPGRSQMHLRKFEQIFGTMPKAEDHLFYCCRPSPVDCP